MNKTVIKQTPGGIIYPDSEKPAPKTVSEKLRQDGNGSVMMGDLPGPTELEDLEAREQVKDALTEIWVACGFIHGTGKTECRGLGDTPQSGTQRRAAFLAWEHLGKLLLGSDNVPYGEVYT